MTRFLSMTTICALSAAIASIALDGTTRQWVLAGIAAAYVAALIAGVSCLRLQFFGSAIVRVPAAGRQVALTFDDGPDPAVTPVLLDSLAEHGVHATFFCVGRKAARHPALVRRILREGHGLGNHSFRHAWWTNFLFGRYLHAEIRRAQEALVSITGTRVHLFRPPMGLTNPHLAGVLRAERLTLVGWSVRGLDRPAGNPGTIARRILRRTRNGSIILLHDGGARAETITAIVAALVPELRKRGFDAVTLDQMLAPRSS